MLRADPTTPHLWIDDEGDPETPHTTSDGACPTCAVWYVVVYQAARAEPPCPHCGADDAMN